MREMRHGEDGNGPTGMPRCPCCGGAGETLASPVPHLRCRGCGHRWRACEVTEGDYSVQRERNHPAASGAARKLEERYAFVASALAHADRVLEVGCAEGGFGALVKGRVDRALHYAGVEVSADAEAARRVLDDVHRGTLDDRPATAPFDLVLCFHVLEHLPSPEQALRRMADLLAPAGRLIVEVPRVSGNRWVPWDRNSEHCHYFTAASLAALCERNGLVVERVAGGGYESAVYNDSLRLQARREESADQAAERYRARLRRLLGPRAVIWGVGGDFANWVQPYLDETLVAAYVDGDPAKQGAPVGAARVQSPEVLRRLPGVPVLIASYRFQGEIGRRLVADYAVAPESIITFDRLFETPPDAPQ